MAQRRAAVIGAGSWGTALAKVLADNGYVTRLWGRNAELVAQINTRRENPTYLPGIALPEGLVALTDLGHTLDGVELVTLVVPSHALRDIAGALTSMLPRGVPIVNAMKGIENDSLELPSQIL